MGLYSRADKPTDGYYSENIELLDRMNLQGCSSRYQPRQSPIPPNFRPPPGTKGALMKTLRLFCLFLAALMVTSLAFADTTGSIRGTVADSSSALISKAHVIVTNEDTNEMRTADTGVGGAFQFLLLPTGTYSV